ncbi:MAG TPA: hypothetical protein VGG05_04385 [Pseudonocardiaceae bacterium]
MIRRPTPPPTRRYEPPAPLPPTTPEPDPYRRPSPEYQSRDEPYEPSPSADRRYQPPDQSPVAYQRERDHRIDRTNLIANTIRVATALIALVFVLHIVFTLFSANQNSGFVAFVYGVAKVFVFGFGDVFTPGDATIGLVANYGLAAIVYLVVGRILYRALRRD